VVVPDVDVKGGEETVHRIKEAGSDAIFIKADVSKATEVETQIKKTIKIYHRLDW
jgi:hypothetical protein